MYVTINLCVLIMQLNVCILTWSVNDAIYLREISFGSYGGGLLSIGQFAMCGINA